MELFKSFQENVFSLKNDVLLNSSSKVIGLISRIFFSCIWMRPTKWIHAFFAFFLFQFWPPCNWEQMAEIWIKISDLGSILDEDRLYIECPRDNNFHQVRVFYVSLTSKRPPNSKKIDHCKQDTIALFQPAAHRKLAVLCFLINIMEVFAPCTRLW